MLSSERLGGEVVFSSIATYAYTSINVEEEDIHEIFYFWNKN
ncbi:hypothetical protein HMPREF0733_11000 [Rothia dentocariosa ATCC 17931]|uniref:Uncharacterized protein n=1 Tax=Rothia dentocariosa (strain ATCC 17931 / CDC X599 / XDIA) TaxID=762948 RepID=E3H3J5_ROTDC|nr:hypothetical protein HMPREF0733_11000 [Rothia dentocariosa ATCC 17931]